MSMPSSPRNHSYTTELVETVEPVNLVEGAKETAAFLTTHKDRAIKTIVLLVAMEAEALPMVKSLNLTLDSPPAIPQPAPCVTYSGQDWGMNIHLVCFGKCQKNNVDLIGTVSAGLTTYLAIQKFQPDLVISAGTAGGFSGKGAAIADVFISSATVNHDRRIPLPGYDTYGIGRSDALPTPKLQAALGLKSGIVSSGNSLDYTKEDMDFMLEQGVAIKEMEAAAVAWSASFFHCPMFCIKSVTDIVDGDRPAHEEFLENLHKAADALQRVVPRVLEFIAGKKYSEL